MAAPGTGAAARRFRLQPAWCWIAHQTTPPKHPARSNLSEGTFYSKGTWCSGITPAQHAGGPGLNPQCVHRWQAGQGGPRFFFFLNGFFFILNGFLFALNVFFCLNGVDPLEVWAALDVT